VIGFMPGLTYQDYELEFHTGDTLFVYTDGLPEAVNPEYKQFGLERIEKTLNLNPDDAPKNLLRVMTEHVTAFADGADQFDDTTMLCIKALDIPSGTRRN
jgi:serine phosphatase RsbU (regulator of sigma subunit)